MFLSETSFTQDSGAQAIISLKANSIPMSPVVVPLLALQGCATVKVRPKGEYTTIWSGSSLVETKLIEVHGDDGTKKCEWYGQ